MQRPTAPHTLTALVPEPIDWSLTPGERLARRLAVRRDRVAHGRSIQPAGVERRLSAPAAPPSPPPTPAAPPADAPRTVPPAPTFRAGLARTGPRAIPRASISYS